MQGPFKVERLTQTTTFTKTKKLKSQQSLSQKQLGEVTLSIPSVPILKYNSHALIEILTSFFDNVEILPSYQQVQKVLKIISLTLNDEILFSDIQSLILRNIHKKRDIYVFFCLWSQYLYISDIIAKFSSKKAQQKIIYTILYVYIGEFSTGVNWYQNLAMKYQIGNLISVYVLQGNKIIEEIDGEIAYLKPLNFNHFRSIIVKLKSVTTFSSPTKVFISFQKMLVNFIKNPKISLFLDEAVEKFISNQQGQRKDLIKILLKFTSQNNLREASEIITNAINKCLSKKINSEDNQTFFNFIEAVFQKLQIQKNEKRYLIKAVIDWFASLEQSLLWNFFASNFSFEFSNFSQAKRKEIIQKRALMFDIFSVLSKQNQRAQKKTQRIIYCQYIYQFFEGKTFDFTIQSRFLQIQTKVKFQSQRQTIMKDLRQIKNEKLLNLMTFNKANFPCVIDWQIDPSFKDMINKHSSFRPIKNLLNQVNEYWLKIESDMLRENKRIELLFNVIIVSIDKVIIFVTFSQLVELIKTFYEKSLNTSQMNIYQYRKEYEPVAKKEDIKKNESVLMSKDQEIHPIIMQAKIVKLLKKNLKKANVYQIAKLLNFDKQKTHQSCRKLVQKGFLQQNQDQTFSYEP